MLNSKNFKNGFTLLEMLVVLLLSIILLKLSLLVITNLIHHNIQEQSFWNDFQSQLNRIKTQVKFKNTSAFIIFNSNKVVFKSLHYHNEIHLPSSLHFIGSNFHHQKFIKIYNDGFIDPQTITWHSYNSNHDILQKFQLGWGNYNLYQK